MRTKAMQEDEAPAAPGADAPSAPDNAAPAAEAAASVPAVRPDLLHRGWAFLAWRARLAARGTARGARAGRLRLQAAALARLRETALASPGRLLGPTRAGRRLAPRSRRLAAAEALLTARARGWDAAAPLLDRFPDAPGADDGPGEAAALLRTAPPCPALTLAIPDPDRPAHLPEAAAARIVVYTAIFGRPRPLAPVYGISRRLRFLCFTDQAIAADGWEIVPTAPDGDPEAAMARHRIRPAEVLAPVAPGAEASLWLEPDHWLVGNADTLLARWLLPHDVVMWRHPAGDWRDMAERHLVAGDDAAAGALGQAARFAEAGLPLGGAAGHPGMIWRRHDAPAARALAEAWRRSRAAAPGAADLELYRALHDPDDPAPAPAMLPCRLGPAEDNIFVLREDRRAPRPRPAGAPAPRAGRRLPVVFLSARAHAKSASTLLRAHQLSAMVAAAHPDRYEVRYTEEAAGVSDAVVVLTKGAMATLPPEEIAALRRRNVAAIGCWDDIRPDPRKARLVDAHMTLSYGQTRDLNRLFPETPSFMVTHHVNTQVPAGRRPPADRLRTGYFGDLENTVRPGSLAGMVELVGIDTRDVNDSWLDALPHYNCHWIVRRNRPWDGWKPFLKGFVAARCGAVAVTTADDGDAAYYLGDDYPFYARSLAAADLEMAMATVAAAFGGADWRLAQDIMVQVAERTAEAQVCAEFRTMIDEVSR